MGIMPHVDVDEALRLALSLDIPFWPQLPRVCYGEDMYVQAARHFPGILIDVENSRLVFDSVRFQEELVDYSRRMEQPEPFSLNSEHSLTYHRFLTHELRQYPAIRGQIAGPISLGFNVVDENRKPIIYDDEVRGLLFDFIQRKVNVQYRELRERNPHAFVWVDEPALLFVFSGLYGYNDIQARQDYRVFLQEVEGPKALHLCPNVNLPYLLALGVDILSFDAYQIELMPREYARPVAEFIRNGGTISWGIVPTERAGLDAETPQSLCGRLIQYWEVVSGSAGIPARRIAEQALVAPARCCVRDAGERKQACYAPNVEQESVARAFSYLHEISQMLRHKYSI